MRRATMYDVRRTGVFSRQLSHAQYNEAQTDRVSKTSLLYQPPAVCVTVVQLRCSNLPSGLGFDAFGLALFLFGMGAI
jgi:hypothetical protein